MADRWGSDGRTARGWAWALLSLTGLLAAYGTPLALGRSWFPLPQAVPGAVAGSLTAYDTFSYAHVDWPWRWEARRALQEGSLPFWNANTGLGAPLAAQYQSQLFLPTEWLELFLGPLGWNVGLLAKLILAWLGAVLFVDLLYRDRAASLVAATLYAFSAYFLWFTSITAFVSGAVVLPWVFWSLLRIVHEEVPARRAIAGTAAAAGILWVTGQPQLAAVGSLFAAMFFGVCCVQGPARGRIRALAMAVGAGLLALGLVAAPLGTFFEAALEQGYTLHHTGAFVSGAPSTSAVTLALWPFSFGPLMRPWEPSLYPNQVNPEAFPLVVGAAALVLASMGGLAVLRRAALEGHLALESGLAPLVVIVAVLGILALQALGIPVWDVSALSRVNLARYGAPLLSLMTAALAARGVVALPDRRLACQGLCITGTVVAIAAWLFARCIGVSGVGPDPSGFLRSLILGTAPFFLSVGACGLVVLRSATSPSGRAVALLCCVLAEVLFLVRYSIPALDGVRLIPSVVLCFGALLASLERPRVAFGAAALGLALHVGIFAGSGSPMPRRGDPYAVREPWLDFVQEVLGPRSERGRVLTASSILLPNSLSGFGVAQLNSALPVQPIATARYVLDLLAAREVHASTPNAWHGVSLRDQRYPDWTDYRDRRRFYNLASVRLLIDSPGGELVRHLLPDMRVVYADEQVAIVEDPRALPRAFALDRAHPMPNPEAVRAALLEGGDPAAAVWVEADPLSLPSELRAPGPGRLRPLAIRSLHGGFVEIQVDALGPEMVVLADVFYPGWEATVDGEPAEVLRAYGTFRAVRVAEGTRTVTLRYLPTGWWTYLGVSVVSGAATLILGLGSIPCGMRIALQRAARWRGWRDA